MNRIDLRDPMNYFQYFQIKLSHVYYIYLCIKSNVKLSNII